MLIKNELFIKKMREKMSVSLVSLINLQCIHMFTEDVRNYLYKTVIFDQNVIYRNLELALTDKNYNMIVDIISNYNINSMLTFYRLGKYLQDTSDNIKNIMFDKTCVNSIIHYGSFDDIKMMCERSVNIKKININLPYERVDVNLYEILMNDQISELIDIVYPFIHLILDLDFMIESYNIQTSIYRYLKKLACPDFIDNCDINKYFLFLQKIFENSDLNVYSIFAMIDMVPIRLNNGYIVDMWRYLSPKVDNCNTFDLFCRLVDEESNYIRDFLLYVDWVKFINDYLDSTLDIDIETYISKIIDTFKNRYNFTIYDVILYFMGNFLLEQRYYEKDDFDEYMIKYEESMSDIQDDDSYMSVDEDDDESIQDISENESFTNDYGHTFHTFISNYNNNLDRIYTDVYPYEEIIDDHSLYPFLNYNQIKSDFLLHNPDKAHLLSYTLYMRYLDYYFYKNFN